jgi:hypothetical protein
LSFQLPDSVDNFGLGLPFDMAPIRRPVIADPYRDAPVPFPVLTQVDACLRYYLD